MKVIFDFDPFSKTWAVIFQDEEDPGNFDTYELETDGSVTHEQSEKQVTIVGGHEHG